MAKLIHAQTILEVETLLLLKSLTGMQRTTDALAKAVEFYIEGHKTKGDN